MDIVNSFWDPFYKEFVIQIVSSIFLGGIIGLDRERKMKVAGIKTNILICLGATVYTSISIYNLRGGPEVADPNRLMSQIVSGIGFIGAGAIIQGRGSVIGLTSAATIWTVAAIGMTIGTGNIFLAFITTVFLLFVLRLVSPLYYFLDIRQNFRVDVISTRSIKKHVTELLEKPYDILNFREKEKKEHGEHYSTLYIDINPKKMSRFARELQRDLRVDKVSFNIVRTPHDDDD